MISRSQKNEAKTKEQHDDDGRKQFFKSALISQATSVRKVYVHTHEDKTERSAILKQRDLYREGIWKVSEVVSAQSSNAEKLLIYHGRIATGMTGRRHEKQQMKNDNEVTCTRINVRDSGESARLKFKSVWKRDESGDNHDDKV